VSKSDLVTFHDGDIIGWHSAQRLPKIEKDVHLMPGEDGYHKVSLEHQSFPSGMFEKE
jgi:hypothetical protein